MSTQEDKAIALVEKAEKRLKSFSLFSNSTKYEDAQEMFSKAANLYKIAKKWREAGEVFQKVAECHIKLQSQHEAATAYVDAANCYKKVNNQDAILCYRHSVEMYEEMGRFQSAAKHQKEIAELYEGDNDYEQAIANFQQAADYYIGEESTSAANQCLLKVALYSAQLEDYPRAIEIYEQVSTIALESTLLKWSVKDYLQRAGLCQLCTGDIDKAKRALSKYEEMDPTFTATRECKFLQDLCESYENLDADAFTNVVWEYDNISKLDPWKTHILLHIKNAIKAAQNDIT